jgi:hypothetical protein
MKKYLTAALSLIIILGIGLVIYFKTMQHQKNLSGNSSQSTSPRPFEYLAVTLEELEKDQEKYDGKKVEYAGMYKTAFEKSLLDNKIVLEFSPQGAENTKNLDPSIFARPQGARIKVRGVMHSKTGQLYGHMGIGRYLITVDEMEVLD